MRGVREDLARHGVPGHPRASPGGGERGEGGAGLSSTGRGEVGAGPSGARGGGRDSSQLKLLLLYWGQFRVNQRSRLEILSELELCRQPGICLAELVAPSP